MGLTSALAASVSGLRATQGGVEVVANNVSNANSPGYTRKRAAIQPQVVGEKEIGVRLGEIRRDVDYVLQRQIRVESASKSYTSIKTNILDRVDEIFGGPGAATSLDTLFNRFVTSWQELTTSPDAYSAQRQVLSEAQVLSQTLNQLSTDVQSLRTDAERNIEDAVRRVNAALTSIATVDNQIATVSGTNPPAALLDQRDTFIDELASIIDIRVLDGENNKINVYTASGVALYVGEPGEFQFDGRSTLDANTLYSEDEDERSVGTVTFLTPEGTEYDMFASNLIRTGEIAAYRELRDDFLPAIQTRLDELAASLALALGTEETSGTAVTVSGAAGFTIDVGDMQSGNVLTIEYTNASGSGVLSVMNVEDTTLLPLDDTATSRADDTVVGVDFSAGMAGIVTAISTALGSGFTVSNPSGNIIRILDDGASNTTDVDAVTAAVSVTDLADQGLALPFFTDGNGGPIYTGSIDGVGQRRGFAARIAVNDDLYASQSSLVLYATSPATDPGDPARPQEMLDRLTKTTRLYSPDTGIGGVNAPFEGTPADFVRAIVEAQGFESESAQRLDEGQTLVMNSLEARFAQVSGVSVDEEMSNLVLLQNAYAANARVMTTVQEMFQLLMRI